MAEITCHVCGNPVLPNQRVSGHFWRDGSVRGDVAHVKAEDCGVFVTATIGGPYPVRAI